MPMPPAESTDGDRGDDVLSPEFNFFTDSNMESNSTTDANLADVAVAEEATPPMNVHDNEIDFDEFSPAIVVNAGEGPKSEISGNFPNDFISNAHDRLLAPVEAEGTPTNVESPPSAEVVPVPVLADLPIPTESNIFDVFDGIDAPHEKILTASNDVIEHEVYDDLIFDTPFIDAIVEVDPIVADELTALPNYEPVADIYGNAVEKVVLGEELPLSETTLAADKILHTGLEGMQDSTLLVASTSEGGNDEIIADNVFSAFNAMDIQDLPTPSANVVIDKHDIVPATVDDHDVSSAFKSGNDEDNVDDVFSAFDAMNIQDSTTPSRNAVLGEHGIVPAIEDIVDNHVSGVQLNEIDADVVNNEPEFSDIDNSNDALNATEGGSHDLNNSGFPEHVTGATEIGIVSTTTSQTEADAPEISSLGNDVAILLDESDKDGSFFSADVSEVERNHVEQSVETSNANALTESTAIGMNDNDNEHEDIAVSKDIMPTSDIAAEEDVIINAFEDFGGFAFSEVTAIAKNETDNDREDIASSKETLTNSEIAAEHDVITNMDEDFGGFAFSEVETEPIDGFPSFDDETTLNLTALQGRIGSMSGIVGINSTTLPADDDTMTNNLESTPNELGDVCGSQSDLVLSNMDDDFGGSRPSAVSERLKLSTSSISDAPDVDVDQANGFGGMASHEESLIDKQSEDIVALDDDCFGDFDAFADTPEVSIPIERDESLLEEPECPVEKGDDPHPTEVTVTSQSAAVATNDDGFGDFGDFEFGDSPVVENSHKVAAIEPSETENAANNDEDDEFGDFGDFDAFEEAPLECESSTMRPVGSTPDNEAPESPPSVHLSSVEEDAGDEFGDFGDFEAFDSAPDSALPEGIDAITESGSREVPSVGRQKGSVLDDGVRQMFQDVFAYNNPAAPSSWEGGTCSELPFDIPMQTILVSTTFLSLICLRRDKLTLLAP